MPLFRCLRILFILSLSAFGLSSFAAPGPVKKGAVTAELVAGKASIQPGQPFVVALKLIHEEHWHSYWINPGTGYPTSLAWKLPEGFTAGGIQWPTPHVVKDRRGTITGNGYEGEVFLFVQITPPASLKAGDSVTLRAKADWLMCEDVCMPGDANLELTLPVKAEAPAENIAIARVFNNAYGNLPKPLAGWTITAAREGGTITVRLTPAAGNSHHPEDVHLFDNDGLVDYAAAQTVTQENGSVILRLPVAKDAPADAAHLTGVLSARNGWSPTWGSDGATFEVELKSGKPSAAGSGPKGPEAGPQTQDPKPQTPQAASGLPGTLLLALLGGLILNLMPCVFPVLGIKVLGFVNQAGSDRGKVVAHGLVFTLGVLLSFWTLAGLLLILRAGGAQLGWGFQLQSPAFVFGMAAFLLVFALNLSGLFEVGLSATGVGGKLQMQSGYGGSFFTGILATLVATPCSAPFLAPALGAALALSAVQSILVFTAIGLGLSAPYLLLSAFPAAIKLLPRPGAWMETFKQFMAFPLYATVGWLFWVLAGQTKDDDYALLFLIFGLVLVAMAAWVYGRFAKPAGRVVAALLLVGGIALGWPKSPAPVSANAGYAVKWEHWSPKALAAARAAGRTVYVDFTARWCATCQTNKAAVFSSRDVLAEFGKRNVLLLKGDWTSKDPAITAELAKWGRSAVPFNLIYAPGQSDPIILPELLTPGRVLDALPK
ncbi:MAG TPA: thioredoxin family protein [Lacunisphaera sp.]|nr:thioredoxin family protein [Lacunisphaera sp.]